MIDEPAIDEIATEGTLKRYAATREPNLGTSALAAERHLMTLISRPDRVMSHGSGSWLYDEQGREHLDFVQGWAVNALGHSPPELVAALTTQGARLLTASPAYFTRPMLELSARLCAVTGMDRVFLTSSGAEANDAAIKLARGWAQQHRPAAFRIVTTQGSFHGRTLACVAASGKPGWEQAYPPMLDGFDRVPFGDLDAVASAIDARTAAVMVEPIQGEAGVIVPPPGYLHGLRELTRQRGVLLILDEIQTGVGRTGSFLRCQSEGVHPDIVTLGKGLGGGVPLAALLATDAAAAFRRGDHGGTYSGNPIAASCGLAVLDVVGRVGFLETVRQRGDQLQASLTRVAARSPIQMLNWRGVGLLQAIDLGAPIAEAVRDQALELGLLINAPRPHSLRFMPQLRVSQEEIEVMGERLLEAIQRVQ